jgi:NTP pyrophosphatase (non-canonical NTP hydrolase)
VKINEMVQEAHQTSREKGPTEDFNIPEKRALIHSEVSEALEVYRERGSREENIKTDHYVNGKPCGFPSELADILIRVGDLAGRLGIDLEAAVKEKMGFNKSRPRRQGLLMKYVYLAGPITKQNPMHNVHRAVAAADELLAHSYEVFLPHLSVLWDMISPKDIESWLALDFAWIERCDALVRLPGESSGSDREVAFAKEHGIPVYFGVAEFLIAQGFAINVVAHGIAHERTT